MSEKKIRVTRRQFLKGVSAGAVAGAVLSSDSFIGRPSQGQVPPVGEGQETRAITFRVNGSLYRLGVEPRRTLADVLRKELGLTGTKVACNRGECGACTVLINGVAVYACTTLAVRAAGKEIETVEGLAQGEKLHPVQEAFINQDAAQCGFCTPGFIMTLKGFLDKNRTATREEVKAALAGNLCRCGAYHHILDAALAARARL